MQKYIRKKKCWFKILCILLLSNVLRFKKFPIRRRLSKSCVNFIQRVVMVTCETMKFFVKMFDFMVRISLATAVGMLYEDYWFDCHNLTGHLYYLNFFKVRGEDVEEKYQRAFNVTYPFEMRIVVNALTATCFWYINIYKKFFQPTRLYDILTWSIKMTFIFSLLQQSTRLILDIFWQVILHHIFHYVFILFGMNVILFVKFK